MVRPHIKPMKGKTTQHYGAPKYIFDNAKVLRKRSTSAEDLLWQIIRNRKVTGLKFRRQHPLNYFIADFYCHEALLVIELDGSIHELKHIKEKDKRREAIITDPGITVLRFTNEDVFSEVDKVIKTIERFFLNKQL